MSRLLAKLLPPRRFSLAGTSSSSSDRRLRGSFFLTSKSSTTLNRTSLNSQIHYQRQAGGQAGSLIKIIDFLQLILNIIVSLAINVRFGSLDR